MGRPKTTRVQPHRLRWVQLRRDDPSCGKLPRAAWVDPQAQARCLVAGWRYVGGTQSQPRRGGLQVFRRTFPVGVRAQLSSVKTALWRASARIARVPGCRVCVYCTVCVVYCTLYSVLSVCRIILSGEREGAHFCAAVRDRRDTDFEVERLGSARGRPVSRARRSVWRLDLVRKKTPKMNAKK